MYWAVADKHRGQRERRSPARSWFLAAGGGFQFTFPDAVALAFNQSDVGMMSETVEECGDGSGVGKDGVPVFKCFVRCNENRASFVTSTDELIEQIGGIRIIGEVRQFINAQ